MRDTHDPVLPRDPATGAAADNDAAQAAEPGADRPPAPKPAARRRSFGRFLVGTAKRLATLLIALGAILIALVTWQTYAMGPWTRNGSVRVQVANVAPLVSGQIVEVHVNDNQFVRQGETLYTIDPFDFEVALRSSKAQVAQAAADLELKQVESQRRQSLSNLATTPEEQQTFAASAAIAKAAFEGAQQQQAKAELDLRRTTVRSPVNGYITNLLLRVGDYAVTGASNVTVIDTDSFWIDAYFEETKLARICVDDAVEAQLMGYAPPILGRVGTVTRGISVSNAAQGAQGLPNVDPIFTWVRLAQRVPVRIAIEKVPDGVPLVSGMTATVTLLRPGEPADRSLFERAHASVVDSLTSLIHGPPPSRPGCLPVMSSGPAPTEALPVPAEPRPDTPEEIDPGLAPGLDVSPEVSD